MILLTSEDYIKTNSNLNDNVWGKSLLPAIREAQDIYLQTFIGTCLYEKLMELVDTEDIDLTENVQYKDLLDDKIQPFLLYQTISCIIHVLNVKLANYGASVSNDQYLVGLTQKDADLLKNFYEDKANFYAKRMQNFLKANRDSFPELECGCSEDLKPHLDDSARSPIFLGGIRGRKVH